MGLKMVFENKSGIFKPIVFCDYCSGEITEGADGNYEWEMENGEVKDGSIYFTHKKCCYRFELSHGGRVNWYTGELTLLPLYMGANLKIDFKKARELAILSP